MEVVAGRGGRAVEELRPRSEGDDSREALLDGRDWSTARQRQGNDGRKEVGARERGGGRVPGGRCRAVEARQRCQARGRNEEPFGEGQAIATLLDPFFGTDSQFLPSQTLLERLLEMLLPPYPSFLVEKTASSSVITIN